MVRPSVGVMAALSSRSRRLWSSSASACKAWGEIPGSRPDDACCSGSIGLPLGSVSHQPAQGPWRLGSQENTPCNWPQGSWIQTSCRLAAVCALRESMRHSNRPCPGSGRKDARSPKRPEASSCSSLTGSGTCRSVAQPAVRTAKVITRQAGRQREKGRKSRRDKGDRGDKTERSANRCYEGGGGDEGLAARGAGGFRDRLQRNAQALKGTLKHEIAGVMG